MSRAANGIYTLPNTVNPVVPGTTIEANWANTTLEDLATGVTDSLDRNGRGSMNAALKLANGTVAAPGLTFAAETTLGFYRISAEVMGITVAGVEVGRFTATGLSLPSVTFADGTVLVSAKHLGMRNRLINGNFGINQRGYGSGAATTAGQYTLDRWKVTGTGGITFSTTNNVTTVTIPSGQTLQQVIEGLNLQSGTHVLSWSGTAQGRIDGGAYGASGAVTATATGGTNMTVEFGPGTVSLAQLEEGSLASRFDQRQYGLELALCQRYYYQNSSALDFSVPTNLTSAATPGFRPVITHPVTMRANPTVTITAQTQVDRAASNLTLNTATATHLNLRGDIGTGSGVASWTNVSFNCSAEL